MDHNLIISNGYYTTLVAISILKQLNLLHSSKYMLAYFKYLKDIPYKENVYLTYKAWNFKSIIDYKLFNSSKGFNFNDFRNSLKGVTFTNILIPINSSTKKWVKGFKLAYPTTNFIFYEEGLLSYIKPIMDKGLKQYINQYNCYYNNLNKEILNLIKNNIKCSIINKEIFTATLKDLKRLIESSFYNLTLNQSKNVLFLPQYYANNSRGNNLKKVKGYFALLNSLLEKGYKVLIKEHPKIQDGLLESYLKHKLSNYNNLIFLKNISQYPIELFLNELNLDFIFSVYSTTLLTASSSIFNLPVFTSYSMLQERINSFSLYPSLMSNLIKSTTPDLEKFLNYYKLNAKSYYNKFLNNSKCDQLSKLSTKDLIIKFLFKTNFCYNKL